MSAVETLKIRAEDKKEGYAVINATDYDAAQHRLLVEPHEMVVKPLGVAGAPPFIIDKKDFDPNSYEKVNQTNAVASEIAKQTDRRKTHAEGKDGIIMHDRNKGEAANNPGNEKTGDVAKAQSRFTGEGETDAEKSERIAKDLTGAAGELDKANAAKTEKLPSGKTSETDKTPQNVLKENQKRDK